MSSSIKEVPPDVAQLWEQLHDEARENYEALGAQAAPKLTGRVLLITAVVVFGLLSALSFAGWRGGFFNIPAVACDAVDGLCTPTLTATATLTPTPTPTATATPIPPTPTSTPTATPTPVPCEALLGRCEMDDFDFAWEQVSETELDVRHRFPGREQPDLGTEFVITNTGACRLVDGSVVYIDQDDLSATEIAELPPILLQGESETFAYAWPPLEKGRHTVTLTLQFLNPECQLYNIPDREFVLELDLNVVLDRDWDRVPDGIDECPDISGPAELNGCPDTDSDGIRDIDDCCPEHPGLPGLSGCPDGDGDGFPEINAGACELPPLDQCPDRCGKDPNNPGCPVCWTEHDTCTREVCTEPKPGQPRTCRTESYQCNPHEVCEPCP